MIDPLGKEIVNFRFTLVQGRLKMSFPGNKRLLSITLGIPVPAPRQVLFQKGEVSRMKGLHFRYIHEGIEVDQVSRRSVRLISGPDSIAVRPGGPASGEVLQEQSSCK